MTQATEKAGWKRGFLRERIARQGIIPPLSKAYGTKQRLAARGSVSCDERPIHQNVTVAPKVDRDLWAKRFSSFGSFRSLATL